MSQCPTPKIRYAILLLMAAGPASHAAPVRSEHVEAELVAERVSGAPGSELWLGLRLTHAPHWHSYWINPGDSGLPTKMYWTLPAHSYAGDIAWPAPQRFALGDLYNFGYDGEVLLPVQVNVPNSAAVGSTQHIEVRAQWLECEDRCIPAKVNLVLDVPISKNDGPVDGRWKSLFETARQRHPQEPDWHGSATVRGDVVTATVTGKGIPRQGDFEIFPLEPGIVSNAAPSVIGGEGTLQIKMSKSDYYAKASSTLTLVLVTPRAKPAQAWRVTLPLRESAGDSIGPSGEAAATKWVPD